MEYIKVFFYFNKNYLLKWVISSVFTEKTQENLKNLFSK